jgi:hypothetical protein
LIYNFEGILGPGYIEKSTNVTNVTNDQKDEEKFEEFLTGSPSPFNQQECDQFKEKLGDF